MRFKGGQVALVAAALGLGVAGNRFLRRLKAIDLRGKVVLITGGSRGLGLALAEEFTRQGATLVLCARNESELERARRKIVAMGAEVLTIPCDITDREQVQRMVDQAVAHFGQIDVLVNNAGIITVGPLRAQALKDFEESMAVMFWGSIYPTLAVLPTMVERQSGHIVNITSIGGKVSVHHLLPYACAKFAQVGFSEGLHAELAKEGIHVLTVVPGLMRTGSPPNAFFKGHHQIEYTLFNLLDTLPFTSISARKAAKQIVHATTRGDAEVILSIQRPLAVRFDSLLAAVAGVVM